MPLPRRSPGRVPGPNSVGIARPRTPFTPADGLVSPADNLFSSPGRPGPGEPPPPAGAPRAPQPQPRRTPAGGPHPSGAGHAPPRPGSLFDPAGRQGGSWWTPRGPGTPVDPRALDETTPIFDEMVSAWFRAVTDPPPATQRREPRPEQAVEPWRFSADAGFHAARAASRSAPSEYTDTGLPRRNPRQNLVPGSVANTVPAAPPRPAEDVRDRLSNYRYGVRRARDHQDGHRQPRPEAPPDLGAGWRFAADVGWRAANAVSTSTPVDFTTGGLPRRTPLDNLVPGSVGPATGDGPLRMDRAEELRGRLGSLQKGLSRGRRSLAERTAAHGIPEHKQQQESE